jgi:hypothetical protein
MSTVDTRTPAIATTSTRGSARTQLLWCPTGGPATLGDLDRSPTAQCGSAGALLDTGGQTSPRQLRPVAAVGAPESAPGSRPLGVAHQGSLDVDPATDGSDGAAVDGIADMDRLLEGRVAMVVRLLDDDRHPVTSREEAEHRGLLPEWERVGRLCVCRGVLPPMPRWLSRVAAADIIASMEAHLPGSSTLRLVCVEFADGFLTVLERDELRFLPRRHGRARTQRA